MEKREYQKQYLFLEIVRGMDLYLSLSKISEEAGQYYASSNSYIESFITLLRKTNILDQYTLLGVAEFFVTATMKGQTHKKYAEKLISDPNNQEENKNILETSIRFLIEQGELLFEDTPYTFGVDNSFPHRCHLKDNDIVIYQFPIFEEYSDDDLHSIANEIETDYLRNFHWLEVIKTNKNFTLYINYSTEEYEIWDGLEKIMSRPQSPHCDPDLDLEAAIAQLDEMS